MVRIATIFMAAVLATSCTACTIEPRKTEIRHKKVAGQRLTAYTPVRRLIYSDVCGSEGPLTLCVNRLTLSDQAALVEARIKNTSSQPYVMGIMKEAAVLLADDTGMTLVWDKGEDMEFNALEERAVNFRMEGHFGGEPAIFMVDNIRKKSPEQANLGFSIMVRLDR